MTLRGVQASVAASLVCACLLAMQATPVRADEPSCPASQMPPIAVPHIKAALKADEQVLIVTLGSSSTFGWMASDRAHSYPRVLQYELGRLLPQGHFAVVNRGINGQDAAEEIARLESDAVALRPQLVIWQVGANGALEKTPAQAYERLVEAGVTILKAANADVIMMDNQRSPRILESPDHATLEQATQDVAREEKVGFFSRGQLMDTWKNEGHDYAEFVSPDSLHLNDRGYACVARALAASIVAGLSPGG